MVYTFLIETEYPLSFNDCQELINAMAEAINEKEPKCKAKGGGPLFANDQERVLPQARIYLEDDGHAYMQTNVEKDSIQVAKPLHVNFG